MQLPEILLFFHLPGDVETLGPVLEQACENAWPCRLRTAATEAFLARSDSRALFEHTGVVPVAVAGESPENWAADFANCSAILTGSETTLKPHRAAHQLTLALKARGVRSYTVQHGYENVGLNYFDAVQGTEVRFASERIFIWGESHCLPALIPKENLAKTCTAGRPAFRRRPSEAPWPGVSDRIDLAVFENLHWHRFNDAYRRMVLDEIERICQAHPLWRILVKPHPQGRWLTQRFKGPQPIANNLIIADPVAPEWSGVTAYAVIARADHVLTTPSTIALDAAQAGKRVAVFSYGLPLPLYTPLPTLENAEDLDKFLANDRAADASRTFVERATIPGDASVRILSTIVADLGR